MVFISVSYIFGVECINRRRSRSVEGKENHRRMKTTLGFVSRGYNYAKDYISGKAKREKEAREKREREKREKEEREKREKKQKEERERKE